MDNLPYGHGISASWEKRNNLSGAASHFSVFLSEGIHFLESTSENQEMTWDGLKHCCLYTNLIHYCRTVATEKGSSRCSKTKQKENSLYIIPDVKQILSCLASRRTESQHPTIIINPNQQLQVGKCTKAGVINRVIVEVCPVQHIFSMTGKKRGLKKKKIRLTWNCSARTLILLGTRPM